MGMSPKKLPKQQVNVRLPGPVLEALRARSEATGIPITVIVERACLAWLGDPAVQAVADAAAAAARGLSEATRRQFGLNEQLDDPVAPTNQPATESAGVTADSAAPTRSAAGRVRRQPMPMERKLSVPEAHDGTPTCLHTNKKSLGYATRCVDCGELVR